MKSTRKLWALALAVGSALLFSGCEDDAKNAGRLSEVPTKTSEQGVKYKLVIIEGRTFVATQTAYGYWTLAGPIDR